MYVGLELPNKVSCTVGQLMWLMYSTAAQIHEVITNNQETELKMFQLLKLYNWKAREITITSYNTLS